MGGEKLNALIRSIFITVIIAVSLSIFTVPAYAQQEAEETIPIASAEESIILGEALPDSPDSGLSSLWIVFRMVLILALAALAIYGVVFFIKRLARPPEARNPHLKILASVPLGADTYAAVISVGSKAWLVGGGSGAGVSLISELTDPESIETMLLDDANKTAESGVNRFLDFRALLNRFGSRTKSLPNANMEEGALGADSIRRHRERLERGR